GEARAQPPGSGGPSLRRGVGGASAELSAEQGMSGEFRLDPLTGEWVNIVGHRQHRPNLPTDDCPFCVGGLEAPEPYDTRWFPNRWPAMEPGAPVDPATVEASGATSFPAVGAAE